MSEGYTYDEIIKALKESDEITKSAAKKGLLTKSEGAGYGIRLITATIQTEQLKQLTRIADSMEKVANPLLSINPETGEVSKITVCQDCCKTAGEKIIKDKSGKEWEVPEEFKSTKKGE